MQKRPVRATSRVRMSVVRDRPPSSGKTGNRAARRSLAEQAVVSGTRSPRAGRPRRPRIRTRRGRPTGSQPARHVVAVWRSGHRPTRLDVLPTGGAATDSPRLVGHGRLPVRSAGRLLRLVPIVALIGWLTRAALPEDFQYLGPYFLLCSILQFYFGLRISRWALRRRQARGGAGRRPVPDRRAVHMARLRPFRAGEPLGHPGGGGPVPARRRSALMAPDRVSGRPVLRRRRDQPVHHRHDAAGSGRRAGAPHAAQGWRAAAGHRLASSRRNRRCSVLRGRRPHAVRLRPQRRCVTICRRGIRALFDEPACPHRPGTVERPAAASPTSTAGTV